MAVYACSHADVDTVSIEVNRGSGPAPVPWFTAILRDGLPRRSLQEMAQPETGIQAAPSWLTPKREVTPTESSRRPKAAGQGESIKSWRVPRRVGLNRT